MRHSRKKKNAVLITIIVLLALVFVGACGYLIFRMIGSANADRNYKQLASSFVSQIDETEAEATTSANASEPTKKKEEKLADNPVDMQSLSAQNPDIYSWITIPDTNINYPVLQSRSDDNFYLDHDIYGDYSFPGAIYSQVCNKKDWSDRVTVLYGHNMLDGSMFADLHHYEDEDFFSSHPYIYIYTADRKLTYKVVSAFVYDDRHIMNSFDFKDDAVFQSWLDEAKNPRSIYSNVAGDVELDLNSKLIVLSTCLDSGDGRYLVEGVQVKDEKTK